MRSPSYCSLSALIWNSSCLACATSSVRVGFGAVVWAMLSAAGTSRASAVVAAARQAAPLSLRTAMHDIGPEACCSTDSGNFSAGHPLAGPGPADPAAIVARCGSSYRGPRYGTHDQARAHSRRAHDPQADRFQCGVWTFAE